jgi:hypothetical protein
MSQVTKFYRYARHIHDPVLSSLEMKGIRLLFYRYSSFCILLSSASFKCIMWRCGNQCEKRGYILRCIRALTNLVILIIILVIQKCNDAEKTLKHVNVALCRFVLCKTHSLGWKFVIFGTTWWKGVRGTADALIGALLYCRTHCFRSKNMCCVILHTSMVPKWLFCAVHKTVHNHLPSTVYVANYLF